MNLSKKVKVFKSTSGANKTRFSNQHESCKCKCVLMTVYGIQSKNVIMMIIGVILKN